MGLFERFGSWLDRRLVRIFGKPQPKPTPIVKDIEEPLWHLRKRVTEEARALWREERMPAWKRKMIEAIEKGREEEGWTDEEIMEKYGSEFV